MKLHTFYLFILAFFGFSLTGWSQQKLVRAVNDIEFYYDYDLDSKMLDDLVNSVINGQIRVINFLSLANNFKGTPYEMPLKVIVVEDRKVPYQIANEVFIPKKRVVNNLDKKKGLALIHEITHVYAVSTFRKNKNRFYDDGLAVYMQHRFGPVPEYPDFGKDLYLAVAELSKERGKLIPLKEVEKLRKAAKTGIDRKLAYLQEGAFTQFLIDSFGIENYFKIFYGASISEITGFTFDELERKWVKLINTF